MEHDLADRAGGRCQRVLSHHNKVHAGGNRGFIGELGKTNWTAWALGAIIVGLEFGTICVYRAGWKISVASLVMNIALACVLLAVGLLVYHETVSLRQGLGVLVCLVGIYLVGA